LQPRPRKTLQIGQDEGVTANPSLEGEHRRWCDGLRPDGPSHEQTVAELRGLLLKVARHELGRRRHQLGGAGGPELEDLADQAANDAVVKVIEKLDDFRGASRFTTWACKFAIFEVSAKVSRHQWRARPAHAEAIWESIPDVFTPGPERDAEEREVLAILARAIAEELTERQRHVFVAIALNEVSIDTVAVGLDTNRNAVYKNLFDARRKLRAALAGAGHELGGAG
jgi:RNA polymerase sigma-70 factor, ECF subfamily